MDGDDSRTARMLVNAATAVFAASTLFSLVLGVGGGDLFDALDDILLFSFAAAALLAIAGSAYQRRAAATDTATKLQEQRESDDRARELAQTLSDSEAKRHGLESRLRERQEELRHAQHMRLRVERARQAEREWARELRGQVLALHRRQGAIGDADDIRELVLRIAIELVGAEKGLLLSREDTDHDGRLDVITHRGFEHDPADSDVAQRFAERVLERDEIVREDQPGASNSLADREIQCLVAVPVYINDAFEGAVVCANRPGGFEELDNDVLLALGDHAGAVLENTRLHVHLRSTYLAVIGMLSDSIATKDPFGATYSRQISGYVEAVAKRLGLEAREREPLLFAALLRDIGKLGISERVLLKPGPLSREEWDVVRLHPQIGCRIVERLPGLNRLGAAIRHHQERWDGTGYPSQLAQTAIPLSARIVAVAAAFSAMVEGRPYRPSLSVEAACREIIRCAGTQFDPEIAEIFVDEVRRRPLHDSAEQPVAEALDEPGVQARRQHDEPLLGHGPIGASDTVTLLYSHRYLLEFAEFEAERARRHARPFAVVMVEVCDLPDINRRDGYAAGDAALYGVARALEEAIATTPAISGRYSGRRLAAIMPKSGQTAGMAVADGLLRRLGDGDPVVRAAVAVWQHGDHGEAVLARARLQLERGAAVALRR
jgi:HD-GYP domain-containing protein (c-di-GMP phosphodiesterase class II)/GGDEF domain-containing protein